MGDGQQPVFKGDPCLSSHAEIATENESTSVFLDSVRRMQASFKDVAMNLNLRTNPLSNRERIR